MLKKFFLTGSLAVLLIPQAFTQDFKFEPLKSQGKIPDDFLTLSSETFKQEAQKIDKAEKRSERKSKTKFYLENSFQLRELLYSGKVLFNDPVTIYLNKVADKLLESDKTLRSKIRIYAVNSSYVNAFATNSGMIFVNLGLISQLETESQLAFVLAHEIVHYQKSHVIESYVEAEKIKSNKGIYRKLGLEEKFLARNNYSKEKESEADLEGIEIYLKCGYSKSKLMGVFDVLQYSYLPFDDIDFDKSFFESSDLIFPQEYFLDTTQSIKVPEEGDDSKSTHPNISTRRSYIQNKISKYADDNKKDFLLPKEEFLTVRLLARFQVADLYIHNLDYEKAIYQSYMLLKEYPENLYLKKIIGKSLYALSKYYNAGNISTVHESYNTIEGKSQQVYYLMDKLNKQELNVLALKYLWKLHKEIPDDLEIKLITDDIFKELVVEHFPAKDQFSQTDKSEVKKTLAVLVDTVDHDKLNKYQKIRLQQDVKKTEDEKGYLFFSLVQNFKDPDFSKKYDELAEEELKRKNFSETKKEKKERLKKERKAAKLRNRKGDALGIDKIVVFNPFYNKLDHRKKQSRRYIQSESAQIEFNKKIQDNCNRVGLEMEMVDDISFSEYDIRKFNDLAFLNNWLLERLYHMEKGVSLVNMERNKVDDIIKRYNTKHFCWIGVVNERNVKYGKALYVMVGILYFPILPFTIAYAVTPDWDTNFYSLVLDLETGNVTYARADEINAKDANYILNSSLYDLFYQIKNKR